MSDMVLTWILRCVVMLLALVLVLIFVAVADDVIDRLSQHWTGKARPNQVEILTFCFLLGWRLWSWVERRIWIGRKAA